MIRRPASAPALAAAVLAAVGWCLPARAAEAVSFSRDILPILSDNCFACHGPDEQARKSGLRLDTHDGALGKGKSGELAIVPRDSARSEVIRRLLTTDVDDVMPPPKSNRHLTPAQVELVRRWIDQGATWGKHWAFEPPVRPPVPPTRNSKLETRNSIDAFVQARLVKEGLTPSPEASPATLIRRVTLDLTGLPPTPEEVAAFERECAEEKRRAVSGPEGRQKVAPGVSPGLAGENRVSLGRATESSAAPAGAETILDSSSPGSRPGLSSFAPPALSVGSAYDRLVDRLLASPRYGERMAWDWLEAARYADSNGYQGDSERTMWPWRDWVVDAFNRNLPFDQFTVWQLAGDRLPLATHEQRLATGFLRNHMINGEGGRIPEENRIEYLFDQAETVATVWLGATFNCTRCHDHKFDPYTQRDYFSLLAFFNQTVVDGSGGNPQSPPNLAVPKPEQTRRLGDLETKLASVIRATEQFEAVKFARAEGKPIEDARAAKDLPKEVLEHLKVAPRDRNGERLEKLAAHWKETDPAYVRVLDEQRQTRNERDAANRAIPRVMVMEDMAKPRATFILNRGNYLKPGNEVAMAAPASLTTGNNLPHSDRLTLARWLVASENPLTARVTVNRLWQSFFGVGLVKTTEDFGVQGEKPANPELLDWLATEFVASGWDVKHLVRLIVTSATYRQSSKVTPALFERDPENRLLARGPRFRMPSWMIRDVALAAAGLLTPDVGGVPVKPYQPAGVWEEATFGNKRYEQDHGAALYRRSLYVFWRRIIGPTMFFDVASRQTCTVKTPRTNVPLHALLTLNDPAYVEAARALAERVLHGVANDTDRLTLAYQRVLGRMPKAEEVKITLRGLERHRRDYAAESAAANKLLAVGEVVRDANLDPTEHAAWTVVCSTLLNLDETLTKE
jgi:mono/diheme cytochrome c family protein